MKKNSNPEQFKQFLAIFTQLGSIVTAVVVLIKLLSGDFETEYRQTLATLVVLAIAILIWVWRWPRITQNRRQRKSNASSKTDTAPVQNALKHFMGTNSNQYVLPLTRRRVEGFLLILVTIGTLIFMGQKAKQVGEELSGLQCSYAADRNAPLLVISEFNDLTNHKNAFVNRLYTAMDQGFNEQISVCLSRKVLANSTEAEDFGKRLNRRQSTTIVVWGDSDDRSYEIHVTPIEWTAFQLLLKADAANAKEMDGWARDYLPQIVLGMTQFIAGHDQQAIQTFEAAVKKLELEPWSGDNQDAFARLYFLLAQLYNNNDQTQAAINAYDQVLKNDPEFHAARLNRGVLYMNIDHEKALADFKSLIDQGTDLAADAYLNRANLQTEWGLKKSDYLEAIALKPKEPEYYHDLGTAALSAGDFETALKAYQDANNIMDTGTRKDIIDELQAMAQEDGSLTEIVGQIVTQLNQPAK